MYFHVYLNSHKYLVRKEEKFFYSLLWRKKEGQDVCIHLRLRKAIQAIHVFSGKGSYFILKGTAKSLRCISLEKTNQIFSYCLANVVGMKYLIIIRMFYKLLISMECDFGHFGHLLSLAPLPFAFSEKESHYVTILVFIWDPASAT